MFERNTSEKRTPVLKIEDDPIIKSNDVTEALIFRQVRQFFEELSTSIEVEIEKDPMGYVYRPCHLTIPFFSPDMMRDVRECFSGLKEVKKFFILTNELRKSNRAIAKIWGTMRCAHDGQPMLEIHILHTTNVRGAVELEQWAEMAHELGYDPSKSKK